MVGARIVYGLGIPAIFGAAPPPACPNLSRLRGANCDRFMVYMPRSARRRTRAQLPSSGATTARSTKTATTTALAWGHNAPVPDTHGLRTSGAHLVRILGGVGTAAPSLLCVGEEGGRP